MSEGFTFTPIDRITARLVPHEWRWARDEAAYIAENWARRCAARSGLFDGRVLLAGAWRIEAATCSLDLFPVSYASFIAHRDAGSPDPSIRNAFAAIVPFGSDGAVLLGVMGDHTANAGQIYFPCGTPDLDDVRDGNVVDLAGSAGRELMEETGLVVPPDAKDCWILAHDREHFAFLRPVVFPEPSTRLLERMERHRRAEADPELSAFTEVRTALEIDPARMPAFVRAYLTHALPPGDSSTARPAMMPGG